MVIVDCRLKEIPINYVFQIQYYLSKYKVVNYELYLFYMSSLFQNSKKNSRHPLCTRLRVNTIFIASMRHHFESVRGKVILK